MAAPPQRSTGTLTPRILMTFPIRVAAIDVGSNAIRFVAAGFENAETWTELESIRAPVRLGSSAFRRGALDAGRMDEAVSALAGFRRRMDALGIAHYRAAATSAVRESSNGREMVDRVLQQTGIKLEPIPAREEARLVWRAIRPRYPLGFGNWLLVDLGGGSVEVSLIAGEGVRWTESYRLGTVRLLEELGREGAQDPDRVDEELRNRLALPDPAATAGETRPTGMLAVGGNIEALAEIGRADISVRGVRVLELSKLRELITLLASLSPATRMERWGLRVDRADVILPAAIVYARLAEIAGTDRIVVPGVGVKEGLLLDVVDQLVSGTGT